MSQRTPRYFSKLGLQALQQHQQRKIARLEQRELQGLQQGKRQPSYPLRTLFWECTLKCNQHCRHCGSRASALPSKDLSGEDFIRALRILKERLSGSGQRLPFLAITGGEPLVRHDLMEVMTRASQELGYAWGLTTNGVLLNKEVIEQLRAADMRSASISIDGFGATHDELRNSPGSFDLVMTNIEALLTANFAREVQVTTIVNPLNLDELDMLLGRLLKMKGLGSWRLAATDPIGRAQEDSALMLNGQQLRTLLDFVLARNSPRLPVRYACPSHLGEYERRARPWTFRCFAGKEVMSILHDGSLAACPNIPRNKVSIQGRLFDDDVGFDLFKVWENRYAFHRDERARYSHICGNCEVWDACLGGSLHTFDFDNRQQQRCIKKLIE